MISQIYFPNSFHEVSKFVKQSDQNIITQVLRICIHGGSRYLQYTTIHLFYLYCQKPVKYCVQNVPTNFTPSIEDQELSFCLLMSKKSTFNLEENVKTNVCRVLQYLNWIGLLDLILTCFHLTNFFYKEKFSWLPSKTNWLMKICIFSATRIFL